MYGKGCLDRGFISMIQVGAAKTNEMLIAHVIGQVGKYLLVESDRSLWGYTEAAGGTLAEGVALWRKTTSSINIIRFLRYDR